MSGFVPRSMGFTKDDPGLSVSIVECASMAEKSFFDFFYEIENFLKNPKEECSKKVLGNKELESMVLAFGAKLEQMLKEDNFEKHYGKDIYKRAVKILVKLCEMEKDVENKRDSKDGFFGSFVRKLSDYWCESLKSSTNDGFLGKVFKKVNFHDKWKFAFSSFVSVCLYKEVIQKINYYNEVKVTDGRPKSTIDIKSGTYAKTNEGVSATEHKG